MLRRNIASIKSWFLYLDIGEYKKKWGERGKKEYIYIFFYQ